MGIFRERFDTTLAGKPYHWVNGFVGLGRSNKTQLHPGTLAECEDPSCKEYDRP
jgi:hypothetical protein